MSTPGIFSMEGRTVLVTGATSGIGRGCAKMIAEAGGCVVATGRNEKRLEETLSMLPGSGHEGIIADIADPEAILQLVEEAPALQGVLLCAGIARLAPLRYTSDQILEEMLAVNLEAPIAIVRELAKTRKLQSGASIVFVSSLVGKTGGPGLLAYSASKAALHGAMKVLAIELARERIRVNSILPGMVRTPLTMEGILSDDELEADEKRYPFGYGMPADVAAAAVYFLSEAGRWVSGQSLALAGGRDFVDS